MSRRSNALSSGLKVPRACYWYEVGAVEWCMREEGGRRQCEGQRFIVCMRARCGSVEVLTHEAQGGLVSWRDRQRLRG